MSSDDAESAKGPKGPLRRDRACDCSHGSARRATCAGLATTAVLALLVLLALNRGWLTPDVRGKVMVVYARRGFFAADSWAGMMSEFHSALGALAYAERHGAAAVRFHFDSAIYVEPARGPSWWGYFFEPDTMWLDATAAVAPEPPAEVHLSDWLANYGRQGGFGRLVYGPHSHSYPMTFGLARNELHRLFATYSRVRPELAAKVSAFAAANFDASTFVLGVHYRGLDTVVHWPYYKLPYELFVREAEHVLAAKCPRCDVAAGTGFRLMVATDEIEALDAFRKRFGAERVVAYASPRSSAASQVPLHKDSSIGNYIKGESVLVDALLLSRTDYLIKGRSSVSEASLVFNPALPYSFLLSRELVYRDTLPSSDQGLGPNAVIPNG